VNYTPSLRVSANLLDLQRLAPAPWPPRAGFEVLLCSFETTAVVMGEWSVDMMMKLIVGGLYSRSGIY